MRYLIILFTVYYVNISGIVLSQSDPISKPCATELTPEVKNWFQGLDHETRKLLRIQNGVLNVPVLLHLVGTDMGFGYFPKDQAYQLICELNRHFTPIQMRFFLADTIRYIANSRYYKHDWSDGYEMMDVHNEFSVMNVYVVQDPSGACGYAYYPGGGPGNGRGGIALAKSCSNPGNSTLAHEVGHYFSLPHTFDQWDSNTEFVNGSNCSNAGDYFCDTPADFLDFRWSCPYTGNKSDPNGDLYAPDGSFFMSYSNEPCGNRFSLEQSQAMRVSRTTDRPYLDAIPPPPFQNKTQVALQVPADSSLVPLQGFMLRWKPVPGVIEYAGFISLANFGVANVKFTTTDTFYYVNTPLFANKNYRWKVSAILPYYPCTDPDSSDGHFVFTPNAGITAVDGEVMNTSVRVYPQPAAAANPITIQGASAQNGVPTLTDVQGKCLPTIPWQVQDDLITIPANTLQPGLYFMRFIDNRQQSQIIKIIIH
jgi:hypothetical protein